MQTLFLNPATWDLAVDVAGNVAVASDPYSQAQDAASAIRLARGELWYDTAQGVPYFETLLGRRPPLSLAKAAFEKAAMSVPGVASVKVFLAAVVDRRLSGQVQITNVAGQTASASF